MATRIDDPVSRGQTSVCRHMVERTKIKRCSHVLPRQVAFVGQLLTASIATITADAEVTAKAATPQLVGRATPVLELGGDEWPES
jgi:hypothetical protein